MPGLRLSKIWCRTEGAAITILLYILNGRVLGTSVHSPGRMGERLSKNKGKKETDLFLLFLFLPGMPIPLFNLSHSGLDKNIFLHRKKSWEMATFEFLMLLLQEKPVVAMGRKVERYYVR